MTTDLPEGWADAKLDDITLVNPPGASTTVPDDQEVTFIPMAAVEALTGRIDVSGSRTFGEVKKGFTRFRDGDVLFAKITPCMENGKIAVARGLRDGVGCGSTEFHVLRPTGAAIPEYLRYFLAQSRYRRDAQRNMQGAVGQQRVPTDYLRESRLPVAPRNEQRRIVSRIEELFSEIDEGERALDRVQLLVERYRQSVLKAAVTGELTNDWRAHRALCDSAHVESGGPSALPPGWVWTRVARAGEVRLGRQRAPQHHQGEHMRPYLRVANVYEDRLDLTDVKEMNFTPKEFETYALRPGDILLNEGQSPELVGRPAMYRGEIPGCCYQKTLLRFRARPGVLPDFALLVFRHYLHSGRFRRSANITTSIAHLAAERFEPIEFPLPPESEQAAIVDSASALLGRLAHLEAELMKQRLASRALREATLKAAFSGELVPQDPSDEPASALLARLAAEPGGASLAPRRRGRPVEQAASNRRTESTG